MHELEVLGEDEEAAEQGEEGHGNRARRGRERSGGEDAEIDEGVLDPELPPDEDRECRQARSRFGERPEPGPAAARGFDYGVDDRYKSSADQQRADDIERTAPGLRGLGHDPEHTGKGDHDDRDVHEEHAAPPEVSEEEAAERRADDDPDPGHRRPCRDRLRPLTRREDGIQDRERGGHYERGAEAHQDPIGDQDSGVRGEGGGQAAEGEDDEPADERETTAVAVAERPGGDQQGSEAKRVPVHDPLQRARAGVQHSGERRQRGVEHRVVDDPSKQAQAEHEQDLLAPRMAVGPLRARHATGRLRVRRWSRGDLGTHAASFSQD